MKMSRNPLGEHPFGDFLVTCYAKNLYGTIHLVRAKISRKPIIYNPLIRMHVCVSGG